MHFLKEVRYPGRFIAIGQEAGNVVAIYGVTGRSPSSQARRYVEEGNQILVMPTDEKVLAEGQRDLLVYPAFIFSDHGFIVANGNQILDVQNNLEMDLKSALPEPDSYRTPRITGLYDSTKGEAFLHSARDGGNKIWPVSLTDGKAKFISTYAGDDQAPSAYTGDPHDTDIAFGSADLAAHMVYDFLAPPAGAPDYRVAVIAVYQKPGERPTVAIKNRFP